MNAFRYALGLLLVASSIATANDLVLSRFDVLDSQDLNISRSDSQTQMSFAANGKLWNLELGQNLRLASQLPETSDAQIYKGQVSGSADSWVRLSERGGSVQGMIYSDGQFYALEAANKHFDGQSGLVFYALKDAVVNPGSMSCGSEAHSIVHSSNLQENALSLGKTLRAQAAATATQSIDIAVIGDSSFADEHSADPTAALVDRINVVDGYFSDQVGVTLNVTEFRVLLGSDDPFTTNDAGDLLDPQLTDYKFDDPVLRAQGLVHLYTGRNLDGTTVGIAFRNALCSQRFGAGLSEGRRGLATDTLIAAHEFGHNFGSPHDGDADEACAATPTNFIMAPSINGSSTFSDCSLNQIQLEIARSSCLTAVEPIDVLPIMANFPVESSVGTNFNGTVRVRNNGSSTASNITMELSVPVSVQLDQTSLPTGCSTAGGGTSCTIASLLSGEQRSLTFEFTSVSTGDADIIATTTQASDANASNDQATQTVIVSAVVDLAATINAPTNYQTGVTQSLEIGVENNSPDSATNVTAVFNASTRLSIESVDNGCSINGTIVNCSTGTLAGNSSATFTIEVSGQSVGSTIVSVTASGSQTDPNAANDRVEQSITVSDAASASANLSATVSGAGTLETAAESDYTAEVQNAGPDAADASMLTIDLPANMSFVSADSSCTINGASATCDLGNLANAASSSTAFRVSADSAGGNAISVSVSSAVNDADSGDNSDSLTVTVSDPAPPPPPPPTPTPPASDDSGGGGAGSVFALLALIGLCRRRAMTA